MDRHSSRPLLAVALLAALLGLLASWSWAGDVADAQREDREDLELFLDAASAGWAEVTKQFFLVPESAAETIGALSPQMESSDELLSLLAQSVRSSAMIDSAYIGYPDGTFSFVSRSDVRAPGGFRIREIALENGVRELTITWTDASLVEVDSVIDVGDEFDPRERPWFGPIAEGERRHWTAPYVFSSSQEPGITHSLAVTNGDELVAVVGIDIRLAQVSEFLDELAPGGNGEALLVDASSRVIAESSMQVADLALEVGTGQLALNESPELGELVGMLGTDESQTVRGRSRDGLRTTVVRQAGARDEWYLAVRAVDTDFIGDRKTSEAFEIAAVGIATAALAGVVLFGAMQYLRRLKRDAERDDLTGAYNRRAAHRELLSMLSRAKKPLQVAIMDLDNFKQINDQHGHPVGDAVLIAVVSRMHRFAEQHGAQVGRLGGDEFIAFGEQELPWQNLVDSIAEPVTHRGEQYNTTASIGVVEILPDANATVEEALGEADRVLFDVKRSGGAGFAVQNREHAGTP